MHSLISTPGPMLLLVCMLVSSGCLAQGQSTPGDLGNLTTSVSKATAIVPRYGRAIPAVITMNVVKDDTSMQATIEVQPLDSTEYVIVANRVYLIAYNTKTHITVTGVHSEITCHDSLSTVGSHYWIEPMDHWFSEDEKFVFCVVSYQRPLTYTYRTVFTREALASASTNVSSYGPKLLSTTYAELTSIVCYPKDTLCAYLPELCSQQPWTYDKAGITLTVGKDTSFVQEAPKTIGCRLSKEQFRKIVYYPWFLRPAFPLLVATITPRIKR